MTTLEDKKKYKTLENVLNSINKRYISLPDEERNRNNVILKQLLDLIISNMKQKSDLFRELYTEIFYGGSFYDGLRVGKPDEFDLDLLLSLPKIVGITRNVTNVPGYLSLELDLLKLNKQKELKQRCNIKSQPRKTFDGRWRNKKKIKQDLEKLIDEKNYLDKEKVHKWMQSVIALTLNNFPKKNGGFELKVAHGVFNAKVHESGPAFTLKVRGCDNYSNVNMDIDLVPCFQLTRDYWPPSPYRDNSNRRKSTYFIVPKPIKSGPAVGKRFWRLSFQEQEREILENKGFLKPSIKLLKKLRDTQEYTYIASYYIKTIALWETEKNTDFFTSLGYVFVSLLKSFIEWLDKGQIPYYWYKKNNLINSVQVSTRNNLVGRLTKILKDVETHLLDDPGVIAKYLLTREDLEDFRRQQFHEDLPRQPSYSVSTDSTTKGDSNKCQIL